MPKSLQLWPPGPENVISNRRLASAWHVMWSVVGPSSTINARIFDASDDCRHRKRMPLRLPSPSSPTLATNSTDVRCIDARACFHRAGDGQKGGQIRRRCPIHPGPSSVPSGLILMSSGVRGASTVSRCAVRAMNGPRAFASELRNDIAGAIDPRIVAVARETG